MDLTKDEFKRAYSPYRKEALFCLLSGIAISLVGCAFFIIIGIQQYAPILFVVFPIYLAIEILVNCNLALLSLIEEKKCKIVLINVLIKKSQTEYSASGHWGSVLPALFPREMKMERYRIKCTDQNGKMIKLHCVMSLKKAILFDEMLETKPMHAHSIIVGKYSRIILKYCDKDDYSFVLNRRL